MTTTNRDELLAATGRYNAMTAADARRPLPAAAWYRVAARIRVAVRHHGVAGQTLDAAMARARDAVARGDHAKRVAERAAEAFERAAMWADE